MQIVHTQHTDQPDSQLVEEPAVWRPHLIWVYPNALSESLDAATWLDTTAELRQLGWRVTLIVVGSEGLHTIRGVEVFGIPRPNVYLLRQAIFHLKVLRFLFSQWQQTDVILFHSLSALWLLPLRLLRRTPHPRLVMDTRTVAMAPPERETWRDLLRRRYHLLMEHLANHWADGRLAITDRMARLLDMPRARLWGVWPSGVRLERLTAAREMRRWPAPDEPIQLVYIGVLHYERNLLKLSQAVEAAASAGMNFTLSLVGDGSERADLERFAARTEGRIRVIPPVPHHAIGEVLAQGHVGVLPFPDEEKFRVSSPIKLFEYLAAGLPVMATRIPCHTDVLDNDSSVFWAEQADVAALLAALQHIWQQRASLPQHGAQAAQAAHAWTWHESARKLKHALEYGLAKEAHTL